MNQQNNVEHIEGSVPAPHIPGMEWERIDGLYWISNTNLSTIVFFFIILIISIFANRALKKKKSKLKIFFLSFIKFIDEEIRWGFWGNKEVSRKYFTLILGLFVIVFLWNIWGLVIDWFWASVNSNILEYLRPINSDLNTTVALAVLTVITFLWVWYKVHWPVWYSKSYLFNWKWNNIWEKCINVFVGWLHFIWIGSTVASLSLRLFWNIFSWIVLIGVIAYLWDLMTHNLLHMGRLLTVPFWFFELFVAIVQALVFALLAMAYIGQAREKH